MRCELLRDLRGSVSALRRRNPEAEEVARNEAARPMPNSTRPLLSTSSVATLLAMRSGCDRGSRTIAIPSRSVFVRYATAASRSIGAGTIERSGTKCCSTGQNRTRRRAPPHRQPDQAYRGNAAPETATRSKGHGGAVQFHGDLLTAGLSGHWAGVDQRRRTGRVDGRRPSTM
jgi:hypothetical protein